MWLALSLQLLAASLNNSHLIVKGPTTISSLDVKVFFPLLNVTTIPVPTPTVPIPSPVPIPVPIPVPVPVPMLPAPLPEPAPLPVAPSPIPLPVTPLPSPLPVTPLPSPNPVPAPSSISWCYSLYLGSPCGTPFQVSSIMPNVCTGGFCDNIISYIIFTEAGLLFGYSDPLCTISGGQGFIQNCGFCSNSSVFWSIAPCSTPAPAPLPLTPVPVPSPVPSPLPNGWCYVVYQPGFCEDVISTQPVSIGDCLPCGLESFTFDATTLYYSATSNCSTFFSSVPISTCLGCDNVTTKVVSCYIPVGPPPLSPVPTISPLPLPLPEPHPQPLPEPLPRPSPVPFPTPMLTPVPVPLPESPTPVPRPTPTSVPVPVPVPVPLPVPVPQPEPVPLPIPEPVPLPIPVPLPMLPLPVPMPIPLPLPLTSVPVPQPVPRPLPVPVSVPVPEPEPVPFPSPGTCSDRRPCSRTSIDACSCDRECVPDKLECECERLNECTFQCLERECIPCCQPDQFVLTQWKDECRTFIEQTVFYCEQLDFCFILSDVSFTVDCNNLEVTFYDNLECKPDGVRLRYGDCFIGSYSVGQISMITPTPTPK